MTDQAEIHAWSDPKVARWLWLNPDARKLAPHVDSHLTQVDRHEQAINARNGISIREPSERLLELALIREQLQTDSGTWSKRREAELILADYIDQIPDPYGIHGLADIVERLRTCRQSGCIGIRPGGGSLIAWDNKCGLVRLCPDESREETQRLAERYVPAIRDWVQEKPGRRVFYAVLTQHNYRPGQLANGKRHQFEEYKDFINRKLKACPVRFYPQHGFWHVDRKRSRKRTITPDSIASIKGSLVVQEDPLSANGDWNVHLNALFLVDGPFDYKEIRDEWGANVEIKQVNPDDLARTILELVKYSAQAVSTKSEEKKKRHATDAPAMVEWENNLWLEWFHAQQGFRRTRSYGCLYGIPEPDLEEFDISLVEWVGQIKFDLGSGYRVDLIPGDNFSNSRHHPGNNHLDSSYYDTGPPPDWG